MKIDLNDKVTRFLVQDYVNQICNYQSKDELNFDIHKLIHTFDVVKMAEHLICETKPKLPLKLQKQILNAALLHDWGRCYEFKNGARLKNIDHGKIGADLIKKNFPNMKVEMQSTLYHNKMPSSRDPKVAQPVLDYVRDSDMLANIQYEIEHFDIFIEHIWGNNHNKVSKLVIDDEIIKAVQDKRAAILSDVKGCDLLTLSLWQLCWIYNLRTEAGKKINKKNKLFLRFKELIYQRIVPLVVLNKKEQHTIRGQIDKIFPNKILL